MISKILRKNTSAGRVAGFIVSNFIGLAIVLGAIQFYGDASSIWTDSDSFIKSDYLVLNKKVTSLNTLGGSASFTPGELTDLRSQPWVRGVGEFTASDYRVLASVSHGDKGMSTYMFFESIPDSYVDVPGSRWSYRPGSDEVPIILSKDYLTLYNFGFASAAGLPQLSEGLMESIPLDLRLTSEDGTRVRHMRGRVAGFSSRLNTILVPEAFMRESNAALGAGETAGEPKRVIVDVSSPGDVAITRYLEEHGLEVAGDKSASSAAFLLKVVVGIIMAIGVLITLLSLFILLLSVSLIMERNRDKLHSLLMLGYGTGTISAPYRALVIWASVLALVLAFAGVMGLRAWYIAPLEGLGAHAGGVWVTACAGVALTAAIIAFNVVAIRRKVAGSFRN